MWRDSTLGNLVSLQRGYDLTEGERTSGPVPVIGSNGRNGWHNKARVSGPGVTVGRSGASAGVVTYVAEPFWPHNTVLYVTDFKGNEPRFVAYLLSTLNLASYNSGSAQPSLNRNFLYPKAIRVPSIDQQRRITSILSAYDDLIENNTRRIAILEEMARRFYEECFVHFRAPCVQGLPLVESPIGPIPQGWEVTPLDTIIDFDPRVHVPKDKLNTFVPMTSLQTDSMILGEFGIKKGNSGSKFQNGDTLLARITPCLENGKTGFVDNLPTDDAVACGSTEFVVMRGVKVPSEFVQLLARNDAFRAHAIRSMSGATGRQRVRRASLEQYEIARPDDKTLNHFASLVAPMFRLCRTLADTTSNLRVQRDLLLPKLISGEIGVSEGEELMEAAE
ncbi:MULTISPECIES: restriction endonuclease subunit S [unclassified Mesorhizobium]|uniref:restriction endonuclease subunit S n=1 Tax=unclassified Mesorhizobium TaxID=325217 RepID=UPI00333DAD10